jgi:hypothetical protein
MVFCVSAMAKDVMSMNRIGPSESHLYLANADGSSEHKLLNESTAKDRTFCVCWLRRRRRPPRNANVQAEEDST